MDAIFLLGVLVIAIAIGGLVLILGHNPQRPQTSEEKIEGTDFIPSQMFMGTDGQNGLAVNERTQLICLLTSPTTSPRLLPSTDLLGSYLMKNGELLGEGKRSYPKEIVTFTNELQRQKESLVAGLHMDSTNGSTQRINLLIVVHDEEDPFHVVNFLDMETKEGGILYEKALSTATHWHYILDGLILEADKLSRLQPDMAQEKEMAGAAP